MGDESEWAYISRKPCGCLGIAVVDNPERRNFVATEVARAVRQGEIIERVKVEYVRKMDFYCPQHRLERELDNATR
jgi:hypothetical protein